MFWQLVMFLPEWKREKTALYFLTWSGVGVIVDDESCSERVLRFGEQDWLVAAGRGGVGCGPADRVRRSRSDSRNALTLQTVDESWFPVDGRCSVALGDKNGSISVSLKHRGTRGRVRVKVWTRTAWAVFKYCGTKTVTLRMKKIWKDWFKIYIKRNKQNKGKELDIK